MNLLIDENLPPSWCGFLSSHGFPATHWKDLGRAGAPDESLLDHALAHRAIILTQDLDFTRLLAQRGSSLPSIIQLRVACPLPDFVGTSVLQILHTQKSALLDGCLVSLQSDCYRLRSLPLRLG